MFNWDEFLVRKFLVLEVLRRRNIGIRMKMGIEKDILEEIRELVGLRDFIELPALSPDLNPLNFFVKTWFKLFNCFDLSTSRSTPTQRGTLNQENWKN